MEIFSIPLADALPWLAGIAGLVAACVCGVVAYRSRRKLHEMVTTETYTAHQLAELAAASATSVGPGLFVLKCEVVGPVQPGEAGVLRSELTSHECVWHSYRVTREYWGMRSVYDSSSGGRKTVPEKRTEVVAEGRSQEDIVVADPTGSVPVRLGTAEIDGTLKTVDRYDRAEGGMMLELGGLRLPLFDRTSRGTIGYRYEEWVLPVGVRTYVLGTATDASGRIEIIEPSIVSTMDEQQLIQESRAGHRTYAPLAVVSAVAGVAFLLWAALS